uniref:Putative secreted protein n=1 Tax=Rhipicephalus microplus TaxID=6941 RepID=A0A6G5A0S7_RHIMP
MWRVVSVISLIVDYLQTKPTTFKTPTFYITDELNSSLAMCLCYFAVSIFCTLKTEGARHVDESLPSQRRKRASFFCSSFGSRNNAVLEQIRSSKKGVLEQLWSTKRCVLEHQNLVLEQFLSHKLLIRIFAFW